MAKEILETVFKISRRGQIGALLIDARISENHNRTAQVTDYEIEDGTVISDHIKLDPLSLSITGFISDTPVEFFGSRDLGLKTKEAVDALFPSQTLKNQANPEQEGVIPEADTKNPIDSWLYLDEVWKKRTPITVITSLQVYKNMIITSLSAPRNAEIGKSLEFNVDLREVRVVRSETVEIPVFKVPKSAQGAATKQKEGKKTPVEEPNESVLSKITNEINNTFTGKVSRFGTGLINFGLRSARGI